MVCMKCGCQQEGVAQFCRQCGTQLQGAPYPQAAWAGGPAPAYSQALVYMPRRRVQQNLQPLGIMWCIFGVYRLFTIAIAGFVLNTLAGSGVFGEVPMFAHHMMRAMLPVVIGMTVALSSAAIVTGYALLTRKPWARVLAIVMGVLTLIKLPFGTALGIYTLWVLAPEASAQQWSEMTRPATQSV